MTARERGELYHFLVPQTRPQQRDPAYGRNHDRLRRVRGPAHAHRCAGCGGQGRQWAQIHGGDGTDPQAYMPMCFTCHVNYDRKHPKLRPF